MNKIKVDVFDIFLYLAFLYLNTTLFCEVGSYAKFHVLSQLIVFLVFFYPCLRLVYFILYILSPCLLVTLQLVSKSYWLYFGWYFEWFWIDITN